MSTKSMITVAAVIIIGAASAALAADDDQKGGFRELGNGAPASSGVNPVDHPSLNGTRPREPAIQTERRAAPEITEGRAPAAGARKQDNDGPDAGKE